MSEDVVKKANNVHEEWKKKHRIPIGKIAEEVAQKVDEKQPDVIEQTAENLTDYEKNIFKCFETHKDKFDGDFYIVVSTKADRILKNIMINYFSARKTCPSPNFDQTVYIYKRHDDLIDLVWTIPAPNVCIYLKQNALKLPKDHQEIIKFVLDFEDGTLLQKAKTLNKEFEC